MLTRMMERMAQDALVGLDVGSTALKVAELFGRGSALTLRRWAVEPRQSGQVAEDVSRLWRRLGLSSNHVAVRLASPALIVKPFEFPKMPARELSGAIRLEAEQSILNGHSLDEMAMDWDALASASGAPVRGVLSIVSKTILAARLNAMRQAGLSPRVADVEALAVWNAWWTFAGRKQPAGRTVLLMNIGAKTTNLVVAVTPDRLVLVRDLQLGSETFGTNAAGDWGMELRDSLAYARSSAGLRELDAVVLTGGGAAHEQVLPLAQRAVACALFERWNPCAGLAREADCPPVGEHDGMRLAVALGLALRRHG